MRRHTRHEAVLLKPRRSPVYGRPAPRRHEGTADCRQPHGDERKTKIRPTAPRRGRRRTPLIGSESDRTSRAIRRTARTKRKEELSAPLFLSFVEFVRERSRKRRVPRTEGRRSAEDPCGAHSAAGLRRKHRDRAAVQQKRSLEKDLLSGKRDSDPRPQPWQGCALPTELFPQYSPQCKRLASVLRVQR